MYYLEVQYLRFVSNQLRNFKQKNVGLWVCSCPFCGDSKKSKRKTRGYFLGKNQEIYFYCHNCGIAKSFYNFLKDIDPSLHREYILELHKNKVNPQRPTQKKLIRPVKKDVEKKFVGSTLISKLDVEHPARKYLDGRKIPIEKYDRLYYTDDFWGLVNTTFPTRYKERNVESRIVIPVFNKSGGVVAIQGRTLSTDPNVLRYITTKLDDDAMLYGIDTWTPNKKTYVVEGPIDSLFLPNALAAMNASLKQKLKTFEDETGIKIEDPVYVFDNQPRNFEVCKNQEQVIKSGGYVVVWPRTIVDKDINDMVLSGKSSQEVHKIIDDNTFSGALALAKFKMWKRC
jgi:hypothetical protein